MSKLIVGKNDLMTCNTNLAKEWNYEKNGNLKPEQFTANSGEKVWWKCSKGHEWQARVADRNRGNGCPICAGKKVLQDYNDLATLNPKLASEWNYEKNGDLTPKDFTVNSEKKVWWKCSKGHEWQATIGGRNKGKGCPYCSGRYAIKGETDLTTLNPKLAGEWDYEKNGDLKPEQFTANSGKKVWWKCSKEHEWLAIISNRNRDHKCPYCSGLYVIKGETDLATLNPKLASEWNYEKNGDLKPEQFTANSGKKVWWKCGKGHEWQATINSRNNGIDCPYCSNKKVLKGYNDLQTVNPTLAREWNYEKNNIQGIYPDRLTIGSETKIWWKCSKGHEWQARVADRNRGNGCPICNSERKTSFPEYAFIFYLEGQNVEVIHTYKEKGYELDVYIPSKKTAIEYDGYLWHKNSIKKDLDKNVKCKNDGIRLYRIREGLPVLNDSSFDYFVDKKQKNLNEVVQKVLYEILKVSVDIDLKRDAVEIENLREFTEKANSLLSSNPKIASEWNYEKNGNLKPEHFTVNSGKKVWWRCEKGHEWKTSISHRNNGRGCPYCTGQKVLQGETDLATVNPKLASEWNYEKNGKLKPEQFMPYSNKKVWWKCSKGHEWQASINNRNRGTGCPYCSGQKALQGYNDLATVNPKLASEWNYEKNGKLKPEQFTVNSKKKVWWKCSKGHEWQATISNRNNGRGCPTCSGKKVLQGYNDLATVNPTLASEWNYEKNGKLKPEQFMPYSNKKVWWKCGKGHEWQASISNRSNGTGCPDCRKRKKDHQ